MHRVAKVTVAFCGGLAPAGVPTDAIEHHTILSLVRTRGSTLLSGIVGLDPTPTHVVDTFKTRLVLSIPVLKRIRNLSISNSSGLMSNGH
ncbi:hypothetical protein NTGHW29_470003 [Candidatus Nitrotoga sp. HW29]|uniref:hypothetical protein n=1 Tax=Candidatus Nitrotoga sp. HW29 TaxID=2886963 RepID=UPI001EF1AE70|nr:hypothetical protein [Candidatus Nitrotoga sp. HW29]CAH1905201.1 hypothetical protein NTGHW29_470003 [Candidatus Nitrotoga sp. HW29]